MEPPPITIHLGLPKTATTCFQENLFASHSQVHYFGKFKGGRVYEAVRPALLAKYCPIQPAEAGNIHTESLPDQLQYAATQNLTPILSREGLAGGSLLRKHLQARLFRKHFGSCKTILFTREPVSFITSYYAEMLKAFQNQKQGRRTGWMRRIPPAPHYFDVNEWMSAAWRLWRSPRQYICYADTARVYANAFGKENVKLFIFEEFVKNPERVTEELCNYLEIDSQEGVRLITEKRANERITTDYIHRLQEIEQSPDLARAFKKARPGVRRQMLDPKIKSGDKFTPKLSEKWVGKIHAVGKKQNRLLMEEWNLPLSDYGYRT